MILSILVERAGLGVGWDWRLINGLHRYSLVGVSLWERRVAGWMISMILMIQMTEWTAGIFFAFFMFE